MQKKKKNLTSVPPLILWINRQQKVHRCFTHSRVSRFKLHFSVVKIYGVFKQSPIMGSVINVVFLKCKFFLLVNALFIHL